MASFEEIINALEKYINPDIRLDIVGSTYCLLTEMGKEAKLKKVNIWNITTPFFAFKLDTEKISNQYLNKKTKNIHKPTFRTPVLV